MIFFCQYCGKQIGSDSKSSTKGALISHEKFCEKNPTKVAKPGYMSETARKKASERMTAYNISNRKPGGWKCYYCDKTFATNHERYEHQHKVHQKEMDNAKKHKHTGDWICKYCGSSFRVRRELYAHLKSCEKRLSEPLDALGRTKSILHSMPCDCKFCGQHFVAKAYCSQHEKYYCDKNPSRIDRKKQETIAESNLKRSITMVKRKEAQLKKSGSSMRAAYNPIACQYIDRLNEAKGWHLQHALNGGEIRCGPYWMDGYDKDLNIVFEYDEPRHHKPSAQKHDKDRQKNIISMLHPKEFWRYDEKDDKLYRVCEPVAMLKT